MTLVDASAWIEFLRGTGSDANARLRSMLASDRELATSDPVMLELLVGTRSARQAKRIRSTLAGCRHLAFQPEDWSETASIYLRCRRGGTPPRSLLDCMLAAVAIRADVPVLAEDRDFERIAAHVPLQLA